MSKYRGGVGAKLRYEKALYQERHDGKRNVGRFARSRAAYMVMFVFVVSACRGMAQTEGQLAPLRFTLKEAVATSLQKSREISLARLQYETSRQEAGVSRSQFLPNLYTGSGIAYTSGFPLLPARRRPPRFQPTQYQAQCYPPSQGAAR